jgi:hypothetical protein
MSRRVPSVMRFAPFLPLLILGACTTVLGIEDVEEDPNAGKGGSDATTDVEGGTKNTGGSSSPTMSMGGTTSEAGDGPGPVGGDGNIEGGNGPLGGDGNMGGAPNPVDPTVHGRIIDFWGKPVPDVPVQLGEEQVVTDEKGQFTFLDVPAEYDVSFVVRPDGAALGWVYQGLTRRDPTLQVYSGRDSHDADVLTKVTGATLGANDTVTVAFGTPDGAYEYSEFSGGEVGTHLSPDWRGPNATTGTAHALFWSNNNATKLPSAYNAYQSKLVPLSSIADSDVTFDLTPADVTTGNVTGKVTPFGDDARENSVFLRFKSGAAIQVVNEEDTAPNNFTYLVPELPDCSVTVMAREGYYSGPMGIAYRAAVSLGDDATDLKIPEPALPLSPIEEDNVTAATKFNFKASADNKGAFVVWMENYDFNQTLFIVTTQKQFTIPEVVGGSFHLDKEQLYLWRVETHGDFATVDELANPSGFMDPFSADWLLPLGPKQSDGSFTMSGAYRFWTAP